MKSAFFLHLCSHVDMPFRHIWGLSYRGSYALIGLKGDVALEEKVGPDGPGLQPMM